MNREGHEAVVFFIGAEVESTPAHSKKTLFVVGYQDTNEIKKIAKENKAVHIFLGANHSFDAEHCTTHFIKTWREQVTNLLDNGFMVTLDYPAHQHEKVLTMFSAGVWQCKNFIPLLSVRIPNILTSNSNLTIKIDDIDFNATNPGVWCLHYNQITDSNRFTDWNEYEQDKIIKREDITKLQSSISDGIKDTVKVVINNEVKSVESTSSADLMGLDPFAKSALKDDPAEEIIISKNNKPVIDTDNILSSYAEITEPKTDIIKNLPKVEKVEKVSRREIAATETMDESMKRIMEKKAAKKAAKKPKV